MPRINFLANAGNGGDDGADGSEVAGDDARDNAPVAISTSGAGALCVLRAAASTHG